MANGIIANTSFSTKSTGTTVQTAHITKLDAAIAILQAASPNVDNCGNCTPSNCCQSCQSTNELCQSCQTTKNCTYTCQSCQANCNCDCTSH